MRLSLHITDVVVLGAIVILAILIPPQFDAGWVRETVTAHGRYGDFVSMFDGSHLVTPLGYWNQWVQGVWANVSTTPMWMRIVPGLLGIGTWGLLRYVADAIQPRHRSEVLWVMSAVFLTGFGGFTVLLRFIEGLVGLLVMASLAVALRFRERPSAGLLFAWLAMLAFGLASHPLGVLIAAPMLASAKEIAVWLGVARRERLLAGAAALTAAGLLIMLFFFDSNLAHRLESVDAFSGSSTHDGGPLNELARYTEFFENPHVTPMRRIYFLFLASATGAYLLGFGRDSVSRSRLAGRSLLIGLGLLSLMPSKWIWHFGGLIGLVALVVAVEGVRRSRASAALLAGGTALAMAWVWSGVTFWAPLGLRTQRWWPGAVNLSPFDLSNPLVWAGIGLMTWGVVEVVRARFKRHSISAFHAVVLFSAIAVLGVTTATFALDIVRTDGWTQGRQNLRAITGRADCGLGEVLRVPMSRGVRPIPATGAPQAPEHELRAADAGFGGDRFDSQQEAIAPWWLAGSPIDWVRVADGNGHSSEWYAVSESASSAGVFSRGGIAHEDTRIVMQWATSTEGGILAPVIEHDFDTSHWTLLRFDIPPGAGSVRVIATARASVDVSPPLVLRTDAIAAAGTGNEVLVDLPVMQYFPCLATPQVERGVVATPDIVVHRRGAAFWQTIYSEAIRVEEYVEVPVEIPPDDDGNELIVLVSRGYLTGSSYLDAATDGWQS